MRLLRNFFYRLTEHIIVIYISLRKRFISAPYSLGKMVGLTYANEGFTDGAGAQLQRIYGIYAISRFLGLPYIHSPLLKLDYQGIGAVENNALNQDLASDYNRVFKIPSDIDLPDNYVIHDLRYVNLISLFKLNYKATKSNTFILARITLPYGITDRFPELYQVVKKLSPFPDQHSSVFRIVMHVRKGDLLFVNSERMLPNAYFISVVQKTCDLLDDLNTNYVVELHTDLPTKEFIVTPTNKGIHGLGVSESMTVDPRASGIEEFNSIPRLEKYINHDPLSALQSMATANL